MDTERESWADVAGAVAMLRRQRWVIVVTAAVVTAAALVSALLASPVYSSSAEVAVEPVRWGAETAMASSNLVQQELATQLRIATSEQVANRVAEDVSELATPQLLDRISAEQLGQTRVIRLVARDTDPERAAQIASGFADAYLEGRRQEVVDRLDEATADLQARMEEVRARIVALEEELAGGEGGVGSAATVQERDSLLRQLGDISTQLTSLEASGAVARTGGEVIRQASVPGAPLSPQPVQRAALGLLVGVLLGLAVAWTREHLDDLMAPSAGTIQPSPGP